MLFNSYPFIFLYLPIVFFGFFIISKRSFKLAALWLAIASLFFYGWWNPKFILLLLASILFNYTFGYLIGEEKYKKHSKKLLVFSITINLVLLGVYKYANFFIDSANTLGANWNSLNIILPLGISFFTFTQIAFLVDVYSGIARERNFIHYLLFVTWFPHLIAGPVLHHKQMMPQFGQETTYKPNNDNISIGLTIFAIGLFKKVILADNFAPSANSVFDIVAHGGQPMLVESWIGTLAYTLQLYFDFSGYSDMAIGLSLMFNVKLPINFDSPYKSANIIDFWRRWHMTLSKFLADYLYIPLGGNRKGPIRRYVNLITVMLLGGLWHGAGWNFVLWGGLHGLYLMINHAWRGMTGSVGISKHWLTHTFSIGLTFLAVMLAWIPFRATSLDETLSLWKGLVGLNGFSLPIMFEKLLTPYLGNQVQFLLPMSGINIAQTSIWILAGLIIIWCLPNTQRWLGKHSPVWNPKEIELIDSKFAWRPIPIFAITTGLLFAISIIAFKKNSPFLYFQF